MGATLDQRTFAEILPGTWSIAATNFPMWLTGGRAEPRFTYGLVSSDPLVLTDDVSYLETTEKSEVPVEKHILGQDTWNGDEFVWRGRRLLRLFSSHWSVGGFSDDGTVAVIHFSKSLATPAGVDVIVREGTHHPELRAMIAHATDDFGLSPEEFGSLSWLAVTAANG